MLSYPAFRWFSLLSFPFVVGLVYLSTSRIIFSSYCCRFCCNFSFGQISLVLMFLSLGNHGLIFDFYLINPCLPLSSFLLCKSMPLSFCISLTLFFYGCWILWLTAISIPLFPFTDAPNTYFLDSSRKFYEVPSRQFLVPGHDTSEMLPYLRSSSAVCFLMLTASHPPFLYVTNRDDRHNACCVSQITVKFCFHIYFPVITFKFIQYCVRVWLCS